MRAVLIALGVLAFAPASAAAEDLSVAGSVTPGSAANERTVRFTVTNHGPDDFSGVVRLTVRVDPALAYLRLVNACNLPQGDYSTATCFPFVSVGTSQSFHLIAGFRATRDFHRDQVKATLTFTENGQPAADANAANDTATVDLGIVAPPASLGLQAVIPGIVWHGEPATHTYVLSNTGGQDLSDVRVSDSRCTGPQRVYSGSTYLRPGALSPPLGITCVYTPPPHRRGEPRKLSTTVTATARTSAGQLVTATVAHSSAIAEPRRACGIVRARVKGKATRWKTDSTVADRTCKTVRRQLRACLRRHRAPAGFRCHTSRALIRLWRPGASVPTDMQAKRA